MTDVRVLMPVISVLFALAAPMVSAEEGDQGPALVLDDKPYVVVAGGFRTSNTDADTDANALLEKLHGAGFANAEVVDSRVFEKFACCFRSVIAGRYADRDGAKARLAEVEAAGFDAFVKKAFEPRQPIPDPPKRCLTAEEVVVEEVHGGDRWRLFRCVGDVTGSANDGGPEERNLIDNEILLQRFDAKGRFTGSIIIDAYDDFIYEQMEPVEIGEVRAGERVGAYVVVNDDASFEHVVLVVLPSGKRELEVVGIASFSDEAVVAADASGVTVTDNGQTWRWKIDGTTEGSSTETNALDRFMYQKEFKHLFGR